MVTHAQAFFTPFASTMHSFWSRGDDFVQAFITLNGSLVKVSETPRYTNDRYAYQSQANLTSVFLEAGCPYLLDVWGYDGNSLDYVEVGVRVHQSDNFTTTRTQRVRCCAAVVFCWVSCRCY